MSKYCFQARICIFVCSVKADLCILPALARIACSSHSQRFLSALESLIADLSNGLAQMLFSPDDSKALRFAGNSISVLQTPIL